MDGGASFGYIPRSGKNRLCGRSIPNVSEIPPDGFPEWLSKFAFPPAVEECLLGTAYSSPRERHFTNFMIFVCTSFFHSGTRTVTGPYILYTVLNMLHPGVCGKNNWILPNHFQIEHFRIRGWRRSSVVKSTHYLCWVWFSATVPVSLQPPVTTAPRAPSTLFWHL